MKRMIIVYLRIMGRVCSWSTCLLFILSLAVPVYAGKKLTVEQIYGTDEFKSASVDAVQWTPDGTGFTYLQTDPETDTLEIWYCDGETGEKRRLVTSDDIPVFQERRREKRYLVKNYLRSPAGGQILFPHENDLYLFDLRSKDLKQLTDDDEEERDPVFSPDGNRLAFLKQHNLQVLDINDGSVITLTEQGTEDLLIGRFDWVYEEEFGIRTGFFWSPDGEHIAYFQVDQSGTPKFPIIDFLPLHNEVNAVRYPKPGEENSIVRIGVVPTRGSLETVWMDIGGQTDMYTPRIKWLPDGDALSIQQINRQQNRLDLFFADVRTGESRIVLTEESPGGWLEPVDDLRFLSDGESFLWTSRRDGFKHLYLYHYNGWLKKQLTSGDWDVTKVVGIDEDEETVYFVGTRKSPLERHLYAVHLDGKGLQQLTEGDGTHNIDMDLRGCYYLDTFSSLTTPPRTSLHRIDGQMVAVVEPNELRELLEEYDLSEPEFVTVPTEDGTWLNAFIMKPTDFDPSKRYPVLIYAYGGPESQIVRNDWRTGMGNLWHQLMAQHGYIIFGLDNRGTGGRGNEWMWAVYRNLGEYEVKDHVSGVQYLRTLPYVDADRIGIWGWSYGGYTTVMCLLKESNIFKAGVAVAPVTDWKNYDTIYTEKYMGMPEENPAGYDRSAASYYADRLQGRLLLVHGGVDDNVHMANTMQLVQTLQDKGKQFQLMIYPGKEHSIRGKEARVHLYEMITAFLLENL